uniref:Uncharacterized protein n=1 Tax=Amicula sp. isolate GU52X-4 cfCalB7 TaxID=3003489 RepID=A0A9E9C3F8_9STRA|nr:hypothetical protein [Amicula sp. isolate GU52X-4 cfCalB7]WAK84976.1 hypothetical protein [Amicula sp. isolate GU52X-4 cfCalB7]
MRFSKKDNVYRIARFASSQANILGVVFGSDDHVEVIEWPIKDNEKVLTSKDEVLKQVTEGLNTMNKNLVTNFRLSKIYFVPSDNAAYSVYRLLICKLIRHYHNKKEFEEL